ncbi:hypothetical protein AVEN_41615-1 [Araneus ventricosus]|uniref:Uncharacterized protein n=1 Tax=Araneus ventricosus TaxID=182803 RepID=A0A4Y2JUR4_ARAVE|nr:hypothetical protein AVEN_41615-1 [Araneus ventricosus]
MDTQTLCSFKFLQREEKSGENGTELENYLLATEKTTCDKNKIAIFPSSIYGNEGPRYSTHSTIHLKVKKNYSSSKEILKNTVSPRQNVVYTERINSFVRPARGQAIECCNAAENVRSTCDEARKMD